MDETSVFLQCVGAGWHQERPIVNCQAVKLTQPIQVYIENGC